MVSNDLTKYLLAVDRNNARVSTLYDSLHPSVIHALSIVVENSHKAGKKVSICGEMAGDPLAVIILIGLGFDALSVSATNLLKIKCVIRRLTHEDTRHILQEVLKLHHPSLIRQRLQQALEERGISTYNAQK